MHHRYNLFLGKPLDLPKPLKPGCVLVMESAAFELSRPKITGQSGSINNNGGPSAGVGPTPHFTYGDLVNFELKSSLDDFTIKLFFNPKTDTIALKLQIGDAFTNTTSVVSYKAFFPTIPLNSALSNPSSIQIHDCGSGYQFIFNGKRAFENYQGLYRTGIDTISYTVIMKSAKSPFSDPLTVIAYPNQEEYTAHQTFLTSLNDSVKDGPGRQSRANPSTDERLQNVELRERMVDQRERTVIMAEKYIAMREQELLNREKQIVFRERKLTEEEKEVAEELRKALELKDRFS